MRQEEVSLSSTIMNNRNSEKDKKDGKESEDKDKGGGGLFGGFGNLLESETMEEKVARIKKEAE